MDSHPTSESAAIRLLDADGAPAPVAREWRPMWVEVAIPPERWEAAELWRGEERLPLTMRRLGGAVRVLAEWPRSGPGNYELRLDDGGTVHSLPLTVHPEKIGQDEYARLLEDLESRLPASIALGLQRVGGLAGMELLPPRESTLAEEVLRLRRAVFGTPQRPGLAAALVEIARDPHCVLASTEQWVPSARARRPHPARLPRALARSGNLGVDLRPLRVLDTRVEHSVDVYENRLVRTFLLQVQQRLRRLILLLPPSSDSDLLDALGECTTELEAAARQAPFLREVRELSQPQDRASMVLLKRPAYRAAFEGYLEFQRRVAVQIEDDALDAPLENLPYLYQLWGTLHVMDAVLEIAGELGYRLRRQRLVGRTFRGAFLQVLPDGRPALVLTHPGTGAVAKLIPERSYGSAGALRSVSFIQRPDVALEVGEASGARRVALFDPKYKLDGELLAPDHGDWKPKKVDIDKMHAYRDAIRDGAGERAVEYAAILYPGPAVVYAAGLEALSARPATVEDLRTRVRDAVRRTLLGRSPSVLNSPGVG